MAITLRTIESMEWTWSRIFAAFSGLSGFTFNTLLVPIIICRSSTLIGSYKYLLLLYTLDSAIYSLSQLLTLPTLHVSHRGLILYQQLPLLPRWAGTTVIFIFIYTHAMLALILSLCFIYRYLVMKRPEKLVWFENLGTGIIIYSIPFVVTSYMVGTAVVAICPTSETDAIFAEAAYNATHRNISEMAYIGAPIFDGKINPKMMVCVWSFASVIAACSFIIFFCAYGIINFLSESMNIIIPTRTYNTKLFWLLLMQTLFPLMFTFTPPLVAWTLALLQINLGEILSLFGDIMSIAQVIDPLLVFYFIADYRRALLKLFSKRSYNGTIAPDTRETAALDNLPRHSS